MATTKFPHGPNLRIHVTKEAIERSIVSHSGKCWIAECIKETVPDATWVAVDVATIRFSDPHKGLRYVYLTPYSAQLALLQFDEGKTPPPFSFRLRNAHVTSAGVNAITKEKRKTTKEAKRAIVASVSGSARLAPVKKPSGSGSSLPRRIGGRRPPQLRMLRKFGVRAFRGSAPPPLPEETKTDAS